MFGTQFILTKFDHLNFLLQFFASGSAETMTIIESNKERYQKLMGTQTQLSPNDVVTLNSMYKCYSGMYATILLD